MYQYIVIKKMKVHLIEESPIKLKNGQIEISDRAIRRGATFHLPLFIQGDFSEWIPRAQIRNNYAEQGGKLIAEFTFDTSTFDITINRTKILGILRANITAGIPSTKYQGGPNLPTSPKDAYIYDLELVDSLDPTHVLKLIDISYIQVKPEVTIGD